MRRLSRFIVTRRVWVLVATGVLALIGVLVGGDVAQKLSLGGTEDPASESVQTENALAKSFRQAAQRFKDVLVVVPAVDTEPIYPAGLGLDNVLAVSPGAARAQAIGFGGVSLHVSGAVVAVAMAAVAAAELRAREPALDAAALKRRLGEAGGGANWQAQR